MIFVSEGTLSTTIPYTNSAIEHKIQSFYIDKNLVSVEEFTQFVKTKNFVTDAEKFGNSTVFDNDDKIWKLVDSANYIHPLGKSKEFKAAKNHPVTQVSWQDASYYCSCQGKRLPTDAEWEFAAKNGKEKYNDLYAWGNHSKEGKKFKANFWQGHFPTKNTVEDGFLYTSPIGFFGENKLGISDMGGNVWQWCADDIEPTATEVVGDPAMRKVLRGGSFLCDPAVCHGFKVSGRSSSTPETASNHVGFRCVKDIH